MGPRYDARQRRLAELGRLARLHQNHRRGAVIDARGVACGDRALLVEGGAQLAERFERGAVLGIFVRIDDNVAFATLDGHWRDFVLELAGLLRRLGLVLRRDCKFVLLLARDLPLPGDVLRGIAHVIAVEGIP